jgi:DNA polymerase IV
VTLEVKFIDFEIITRSGSIPAPVSSRSELEREGEAELQRDLPI